MRHSVTFLRTDLTDVGRQYFNAAGTLLGTRSTAGVVSAGAGLFFVDETPPSAAVGIRWNSLLVPASDLRVLLDAPCEPAVAPPLAGAAVPESFDLPGGLSIVTLPHRQGTITPQITVSARIAGGGWRSLDGGEYAAEFLDDRTVEITFPYVLEEHPAAGAVRVTISNGTATAVVASYAPGAAGLLQQGLQFFQAQRSTVTITIDGVEYSGGGGDLVRERDLINGGWLNKYRVSFWVDLAQFAAKNQPVPVAHQVSVTWQGVDYALDKVTPDGTGATVMLECISPEE